MPDNTVSVKVVKYSGGRYVLSMQLDNGTPIEARMTAPQLCQLIVGLQRCLEEHILEDV